MLANPYGLVGFGLLMVAVLVHLGPRLRGSRLRGLVARTVGAILPADFFLDRLIREGQSVREWIRYEHPSERDVRVRSATWALKAGNWLADRLPAHWDEFLHTGTPPGTDRAQRIAYLDLKLDVLKRIRRSEPRPTPEIERDPLIAAVQKELVATIDEGNALADNIFKAPNYGPYVLWRDKATGFIAQVFGPVERQRFNEAYPPDPTTLSRNLQDHLRRLADLRDRPQSWQLLVGMEGLRKAAAERRFRDPGDRIVEAWHKGDQA